MIFLQLFLSFLKIGAIAFGGGYGMLSFMIDECLANQWLTYNEILNFIAVAESMPGPIAVDMATFIGASQGGFFGALISAFSVVLTSFLLMLIIAKFLKNFLNYPIIRKILNYVQPVVIAIILATAVNILLSEIFELTSIKSSFSFNWKGCIILFVLFALTLIYKNLRKKSISPIILIIFAGILGLLFYGI